jgi:hypothetical protein
MNKAAAYAVAGALALSSLSGCAMTRAEKGAVIGAGAGAAVGAVATRSVGGAAVGAGIGSVVGYILGRKSYPCTKIDMFGRPYQGTCFRP